MKTRMLFVTLLACCLALTGSGYAQEGGAENLTSFDQEKLESLREESRFKYYEEPPKGEFSSIPRRLFRQFMRNLSGVFNGTANPLFTIIFYMVLAAIFIFVIIKLLNIDAGGFLKNSGRDEADYEVAEENLHEINFEEAIQAAMANAEYRRAIRLVYLFSLKLLTDKEVIDFVPGKTNYEYQQELGNNQALLEPFQGLSHIFAYAWYGNFEVSQDDTQQAYGYLSPIKNLTQNEG